MANPTRTPGVGRPPLPIDKDSLAYLRSLNFTWDEISSILGVSTRTLQRRARVWNISRFSVITDQALDHEVHQIKVQFPNSGEIMIGRTPIGSRYSCSKTEIERCFDKTKRKYKYRA